MAAYALTNQNAGTPQAMSTSFKTLLNLSASNAVQLSRAEINEFIMGVDGTPADQAMSWNVSRTSAIGTGTSSTPVALDPADGATLMVGTVNHTGEPTVTGASGLLDIALNQRTTHRWLAQPGQELIVPSTNLAGICLRAKSPGYTGVVTATLHFHH